MGTFIQAIGRELGYSNIVIDIGDGIRMPWNMMDCCDEIYMCETGNYIENMRLKNFEKYLLEQGMDNIIKNLKRYVNEDENINNDDIKVDAFCSFEELCRNTSEQGGNVMDELYIKLRRHVYERLDIGRDVADSELYEVIDACIYDESRNNVDFDKAEGRT